MKHTVLIVEDHIATGESLLELLGEFGYRGIHEKTAEDALDVMRRSDIDVVLADLALPGHDGMWLLEQIKESALGIPLIVVTGNASIESAVTATKMGAYDYLQKPIDVNRLETVLLRAVEWRMTRQREALSMGIDNDDPFREILGISPGIEKVKNLIRKAAPTQASILILGESGTGKELVAKAIVACSHRNRGPFLAVNSAALPKDTLESELFGHIKGAFTGAIKDRKGRFELADGGTLFLDEIGDMPIETQVKLLRVIQEGEFERVGGSEVIKVDVRIIAATNQDLDELVKRGSFREDLYYRLNVIQVVLPPLRRRKEDIVLLAETFLKNFCRGESKRFREEAIHALRNYGWPGNIRELRNIMERLSIIVSDEVIGLADLPSEISQFRNPPPDELAKKSQPESLDELEKQALLDTLRKTNGVKSEAAKILGIGLKTLYRKLEKYEKEGVDLTFLNKGV
ncbi:MAG: sigma-54-dependent Fis family transcriptional regulator [Planctomycetes bacterium]|nr:sigma-54-dependent Fis family transcriptional regulator [Planctomycetota bacterium]